MLRISVLAPPRRLQAAIASMGLAVLVFASASMAALYDLDVPNGDYNVGANWIIQPGPGPGTVPTDLDEALVRNGGTLEINTIDGNATASFIRIGAGPQGGDPAGPPTYGGTGTLNWTGGDILGGVNGPRMTVGQYDSGTNTDYTGIVHHSGGKISLNVPNSRLEIGIGGVTPTPTSEYNLSGNGVIGIVAQAGGNNGINVRNGTFNMTGGSIVADGPALAERAITVASANNAIAYANFSGGVVDVNNGMRMNSSNNTTAYVTISGTASLRFLGNDVQLGASGPNTLGQIDMSGGTLKVGDGTIASPQQRRLIVGDNGVGVFNLSNGNVIVNHELVVANNSPAINPGKGTFYQTGGTLTARSVILNRNNPSPQSATAVENATVIIDGPAAVFNQENTGALLGATFIGQNGVGRFELRQGQANLRFVELSATTNSRATLNVTGGKMKIADGLNRIDGSAATKPVVNLTGGEVELAPFTNPASTTFNWHADLDLMGSDFDPKPGARMTVNVGVAGDAITGRPADFSINQGSIWDLDIISNNLNQGADQVNVVNGSLDFNGGWLRIHNLYTPQLGDTVRIGRVANGGAASLNFANLHRTDRHWVPFLTDLGGGIQEVRLTYVPEPTSAALLLLGAVAGLSVSRRSRSGTNRS